MYRLEIIQNKNIPGTSHIKVKRGDETLAKITATQKYNQARLAKLVILLGMNDEAKDFMITSVKEYASLNEKEIPSELRSFINVFENYVA